MAAADSAKQTIHDVLKASSFGDIDDSVDVSDGPEDSIHLVIVSRKFDGLRTKEKHDLVWKVLQAKLPKKVWNRVSLTVCRSPEEIKVLI